MADGRPTLATLLRGRSRREVAAFVAALYDARGVTTHVDDGVVVVDGDRYVVVPAGVAARVRDWLAGTPVGTADSVVAVDASRAETLATRYDVVVLTPADLDRLARYGLDRETADAVVRDQLGVGLDAIRPAEESRPPGASAAAGGADSHARTRSGSRRRDWAGGFPFASRSVDVGVLLLVVVAVVLVTTSGSFGLGGSLADPGNSEPRTPATIEPGAAPDAVGVANEPRPTPPANSSPADTDALAPGVTTDGITDANALAGAHARALSNRSYTWTLTYVEFINGTESGRSVESVSVATSTVYVSNVSTDGFLNSRGPISSRSSYADGERLYRPTADGFDAEPISERGGVGRHEGRAQQYYRILLDGQETSLVRTVLDTPRLYVVNIEGTRASTVRNYTATAHVAPNGVVHYYSGSYCFVPLGDAGSIGTCISLTMQYQAVGETTVEPPQWYGNASNATATADARTTAT